MIGCQSEMCFGPGYTDSNGRCQYRSYLIWGVYDPVYLKGGNIGGCDNSFNLSKQLSDLLCHHRERQFSILRSESKFLHPSPSRHEHSGEVSDCGCLVNGRCPTSAMLTAQSHFDCMGNSGNQVVPPTKKNQGLFATC